MYKEKENFLLTVTDVSLQFAGSTLYKHVDLKFAAGNCYGIIGANGAGKTTLCALLRGFAPSFYQGELKGQVLVDGRPTTEPADIAPDIVASLG